MPAAAPAPDAAVFAGRFSLEATRPNAAEITALADILPPGTPVYFSAVPTITRQEVVAAAASLRNAGLEPVIHVAARRLANAADLQDLLSGLRAEADVQRLLVIGGDVDAPGAFADALAVIQKGRLRDAGIEEIGVGAYPEGHPRIPAGRLESALDEKIAAATAQGLRVHIVSQFSFSPERILAWLRRVRAGGIGQPIKIGMAGPTSVPALLRYAKRCGVAASLRGLVSGVASGLVGHVGPDRIVEALSTAVDLGDVAPHYFSFGGTLETARYACEAATGYGTAPAVLWLEAIKIRCMSGPVTEDVMTQRTKPPFRADHVGSILRTAPVKDARAKREKGEITATQLKEVEDREIEKIIKKQEEIGLKLATDGEYRRSWWHFDFYGMLDNVEIYELDHGIQFQGVQTKPRSIRVTGKIGFSNHPMLEHFKFLKAHTKVMPKMCIPAPSTFHFRLEPNAVSKSVYASRDAIFDDLAVAYQKAIKSFYDAGCRYLQFDDTAWAYLCSQAELQKARDRGLDVDHLQQSYTKCINKALQAKPTDMTITTHVCRGNFRSTFISSGGYEPVAESLLSKCNYDGYFLEYDTDRAGGFEPLRFLPKGNKIVVLGLVTSKSGRLEPRADIKKRIEEATKFVALDQLCLSPQCGFASTEEGNVLAEEEQWAKLRMVVELSEEVWGK